MGESEDVGGPVDFLDSTIVDPDEDNEGTWVVAEAEEADESNPDDLPNAEINADTRPKTRAILRYTNIKPGLVRVFDPEANKSFEVHEVEALLARQMDGSRSVAELAHLSAAFGVTFELKQMISVVREWEAYGFLDHGQEHDRWASGEFNPSDLGVVTEKALVPYVSTVEVEEQSSNLWSEDALAALDVDVPANAGAGAQESEWVPAPLSPKKKLLARARVPAIAAGVSFLAAIIPYQLRITAPCEVRPAERRAARAETEGILSSVEVREGSKVKRGDVLAVLDDREIRAALARLDAEREVVRFELDKLQRGARPEEIKREQFLVESKRVSLTHAQKELTRARSLYAGGVGSKQKVDDAMFAFSAAQKALGEAEAALQLLRAGSRPEEIRAKEAELRRVEAEIAYQKELDEKRHIRAPIDGTVVTWRFREQKGEMVHRGDEIVEIANLDQMWAEIKVPEREMDSVELGMPVAIRVASFPSHPFTGEASFISAAAEEAPDRSRFVRVVVVLDNKDAMLRQDLTGYAEIDAGERSIATLIFRPVVRWIRVRFLL